LGLRLDPGALTRGSSQLRLDSITPRSDDQPSVHDPNPRLDDRRRSKSTRNRRPVEIRRPSTIHEKPKTGRGQTTVHNPREIDDRPGEIRQDPGMGLSIWNPGAFWGFNIFSLLLCSHFNCLHLMRCQDKIRGCKLPLLQIVYIVGAQKKKNPRNTKMR
jgi:hypothetical protein